MINLNKYFDHTLLRPDATTEEITQLCEESLKYDFYSVCVNSSNIALAKSLLEGSNVKICSVVGFPLGACGTEIKLAETEYALNAGADEIDMVISLGAFREGRMEFVEKEIKDIVKISKNYGALVKVIVESGNLDNENIQLVSKLVANSGADFIKTATGFIGPGATVEQVKVMKISVENKIKIKASGGIGNLKTALALIEAGANRLGASKSVEIIEEFKGTSI